MPALRRRARPVGRQGERRGRPGERLPPAGEQGDERRVGQRAPLPHRPVGILHRRLRQLGQGEGTPGERRGVESLQLAQQDAERPAVGRDVVQGEDEEVVVRRHPQQPRAPRRDPREVERRARRGGRRGEGGLEAAHNDRRQGHCCRREDDLRRLLPRGREDRAQHLVAARDLGEGGGERRGVERAGEAQRHRDVVDRSPGEQAVEEPQALLREGEGDRSAPLLASPLRQPPPSQGGGKARPAPQGLDRRREPRHRRIREQGGERRLDAAGLAEARHHLGGEERVAAQGEEVVVDTHPLDPQHLLPDAGDQLLDGSARRPVWGAFAGEGAARCRGRRKRGAVDLAVGVERQGGEDDEGRGQHRLGQALAQEGAQAGREVRAGVGGRRVGDQPPGAPLAGDDDRRRGDRRVRGERRLDLSRLDAEAADLHLLVAAAEELDRAVRPPARQVAGLVDARSRLGVRGRGPRVGDEPLGGQLGAAEIAARHAVAAGQELAGHADRHRPERAVDQAHPRVGDRPADRHALARGDRRRDRVAAGEGGVLGRAVAVDQAAAGQLRESPVDRVGGQHVAAGEELPHAAQDADPALDHLVEEAGGQPQGGDAVMGQGLAQLGERRHAAGEEGEPAAVQERPPDLQRRGVEGIGRQLEEDLLRPQVGPVGAAHQADHAAVGDADRLRPAGRAGGEHHVGERVGGGRG